MEAREEEVQVFGQPGHAGDLEDAKRAVGVDNVRSSLPRDVVQSSQAVDLCGSTQKGANSQVRRTTFQSRHQSNSWARDEFELASS